MMRWRVRKAPDGRWWAHEPLCNGNGNLWCMIFKECTPCGKFRTAFAYAETRAMMAHRLWGPLPGVVYHRRAER